MTKKFTILLTITILMLGGMGYLIHNHNLLNNVLIQNEPFVHIRPDLAKNLITIRKNCKPINLTPQTSKNKHTPNQFSGSTIEISYILTLFQKIEKNIYYDESDNQYKSPTTNDYLYIQALSQSPDTRPFNQQAIPGEHCWVVWIENSNNDNDNLTYQTKYGFIKKLEVNNFLYISN